MFFNSITVYRDVLCSVCKKKARCGNYFIPIRMNFDLSNVLCKLNSKISWENIGLLLTKYRTCYGSCDLCAIANLHTSCTDLVGRTNNPVSLLGLTWLKHRTRKGAMYDELHSKESWFAIVHNNSFCLQMTGCSFSCNFILLYILGPKHVSTFLDFNSSSSTWKTHPKISSIAHPSCLNRTIFIIKV